MSGQIDTDKALVFLPNARPSIGDGFSAAAQAGLITLVVHPVGGPLPTTRRLLPAVIGRGMEAVGAVKAEG